MKEQASASARTSAKMNKRSEKQARKLRNEVEGQMQVKNEAVHQLSLKKRTSKDMKVEEQPSLKKPKITKCDPGSVKSESGSKMASSSS